MSEPTRRDRDEAMNLGRLACSTLSTIPPRALTPDEMELANAARRALLQLVECLMGRPREVRTNTTSGDAEMSPTKDYTPILRFSRQSIVEVSQVIPAGDGELVVYTVSHRQMLGPKDLYVAYVVNDQRIWSNALKSIEV